MTSGGTKSGNILFAPSDLSVPSPVQQVETSRIVAQRKPQKPPIPKVMVWSEYEAYISQVKQIGRSACGPTAVINVLVSLFVRPDPSVSAPKSTHR